VALYGIPETIALIGRSLDRVSLDDERATT
jgi:hypothetical protein